MLNFERQLFELDDVDRYEEEKYNTSNIEENLAELGTLFMKMFSKMTRKKKLLVEDTSVITDKQKTCISIMREILDCIEE